ncbi:nucleotide excision repair endonuclease [Chitinispirillales bacterium ANBcel5]|uniref:nucleotide excision repair endonuclease n=1 Tax=Cellulosispirillum alkaliphilum TaxID=3039283 RepID=UPI002A54AA4A|nr:nucleotide excision repair endonuclease [Chitinispirillales bacterium ANBcel5]
MQDEIVNYLLSKPQGTTAQTLSEIFLKIKTPDKSMAQIAIKSILDSDKRCYYTDGLWFAKKTDSANGVKIKDAPWRVAYLLTDNKHNSDSTPYHLSIWNPLPVPNCSKSIWLRDPKQLPPEEEQELVSAYDSKLKEEDKAETIFQICTDINEKPTIFLSYKNYAALRDLFHVHQHNYDCNPIYLSQLFKVLNITLTKPVDLNQYASKLLAPEVLYLQPNAFNQGKVFTTLITELFERLQNKGIVSLKELETEITKSNRKIFKGKNFSEKDISAIPEKPGVYGFRNSKNEYIYIGKAVNLKRRISGYFRDSDESPEKIKSLINDSHSYTIHLCGSELEALLYEYRLIKKYSPVLNNKINITESKGEFKPVKDCIILLPHTENGKGMSFWFKSEQKIKIRPFETDLTKDNAILKEITAFFFEGDLQPHNQDFPEQEIASRWIRKNKDSLIAVPVYRLADSNEVLSAIKSYWKDLEEKIN